MTALVGVTLAPTALAQSTLFGTFETARVASGGFGAIALENEAGKGALLGPTAGAAGGVKFGAERWGSILKMDYDDGESKLMHSGTRLHALAPAGDFFAGLAAALTELDADYENSSTNSTDGFTDIDVFGGYAGKTLTAGLNVQISRYKSDYSTTYDDDPGYRYESEGEASLTSFTLGVACVPTSSLRLGLHYSPKAKKEFKSESTSTNPASTPVVQTGKDPELLVSSEALKLGAAYGMGDVTLLGGVARNVPYTETYQDATTSARWSDDGSTVVSVGAEWEITRRIVARGNLHNFASQNIDGQGLGLGADFLAGPVELSVALGFEDLDMDVEAGEDADLTTTQFQFGVGATL